MSSSQSTPAVQDQLNQSAISDTNMVNVLVDKFSQEIERLKADNSQLRLQRDNVTQFYKDEFARLWQKYEELPRPTEKSWRSATSGKRLNQSIASVSNAHKSINEADKTMEELRELF